jgi:hypothetical protein
MDERLGFAGGLPQVIAGVEGSSRARRDHRVGQH